MPAYFYDCVQIQQPLWWLPKYATGLLGSHCRDSPAISLYTDVWVFLFIYFISHKRSLWCAYDHSEGTLIKLACKPGNLVRMGIRLRNTNDANTPTVPSAKCCKLKSAIAQYLPKHPTFFSSPLCCRKVGKAAPDAERERTKSLL